MAKRKSKGDGNGHALLAPSASDRWIPCPGSVAANAAIPDDPSKSNPDAELGTAAHTLFQMCVLTGEGCRADDYMGLEVEDGYFVDTNMADAVQVALDWVWEYVEMNGGLRKLNIYTERRVPIGAEFGIEPELCNGTSDLFIEHIDGSCLVVLDYKHGRGVKVYAKDNTQMLCYTVGARAERGSKFKSYKLVIAQPRANKRRAIDEWDIKDARVNQFIKIASASARASLLPNAPRSAGEHCRWCRAAPGCYAYRDKIRAVAEIEFDAIEDEDGVRVDPLDRLTPEQYADILDEAQTIENWLHAVRAHALRLVQNGVAIPRYTLGWTQRRRIWHADKQKNLLAYLRKKGFVREQYTHTEMLSPPQMLKLLKESGVVPTGRRKRGEEPPVNPLDAFTDLSMPSPKLVRTDAESEFEDLEE
jgi:Protein of unknown function (DUF2800)